MSEELFSAVYGTPADNEARQVLADWLQARGDPRGEFIALQLVETPSEVQAQHMHALLDANREAWLAPLGPGVYGARFERGFASLAQLELDGSNELADHLERPAWGCVRELELRATTPAVDHALPLLAHHQHPRAGGRSLRLERIEVGPVLCGHAHRWWVVHKALDWTTIALTLEHEPGLRLEFERAPASGPDSAMSALTITFEGPAEPCVRALNHIMYRLTTEALASLRLLASPGWQDTGEAILALNTGYFSGLERVEIAASLWNSPASALPAGWTYCEDPPRCPCFDPEVSIQQFEREELGTDTRRGRFGEVALLRCVACAQRWLHYFVEYESFSKSGRHFRGPVDAFDVRELRPDNAVELLDALPRHIFGGSYFVGRRGWSAAKLQVDG